MTLNDKLFDYLSTRVIDFQQTTKKGSVLFTCPNKHNHRYQKSIDPTATIISGTDKIACMTCGWRGDIFDVVRLLEADKQHLNDAQITEYLIGTMKVDMYNELDTYQAYKWSLVPIAKNSKNPIEKKWTDITHFSKVDWIKWLNNGLNIGVRTGKVSNITVIDIDNKEEVKDNKERELLIALLDSADTLVQNSPHGKHYIFKYDADIAQTVNVANLRVDIRNDGGQIIVQPSNVDNTNYQWKNLGNIIREISPELKDKLLQLNKVDNSRKVEIPVEAIENNSDIKVVKEGGRNSLLTSIGGVLINRFTPEDTAYVLNIISKNFMSPPLPIFEIQNMMGSLTGYKETEESTQAKAIYDYLKMLQNDVNAKDIMDSLKLSRAIVDKYLSQFVKEGKAIRLSRGRYKFREKVEWTDKVSEAGNTVSYAVPYFDEIMEFEEGDIILVGGKTATGKTTMALNFVKQIADQGVKPFYIYSESGSRHEKIAHTLGLTNAKELKFYSSFHANPLSIEIEPKSFTVLDWLLVSEKENTDTVFKFFAEEMTRKGGILVIMMQLKENYDWFAPNLVTQFPALATRYIFDAEDGSVGHFQIDKIRSPKGNYRNYVLPCEYNFATKILSKRDMV